MTERARLKNGRPSRRARAPWWRRHDPRAPRYTPLWAAKPNVMSDCAARARLIYDDREHAFHELLKRRRGRKTKTADTRAMYSVTRKRSDRSEAHALAAAFFLGHCDLRSLRVGRWDGGQIGFYTLEGLAKGIGISPWQLDRVISDFNAAGWIYRHQSREQRALDDGKGTVVYLPHTATLKMTLAGLATFGMSEGAREVLLRREDDDERRLRLKAARKREATEALPAGTLVSQMIDPALADVRQGVPEVRAADRPAYNQRCFDLAHTHPDWDTERVQWEARRWLYPPPQSER